MLLVFCTALIVHAGCSLKRRWTVLRQRQPCLERVDAQRGLLSITASSEASPADVGRERSSSAAVSGRRLTVLTLTMVLGVLAWGCAAAAAVFERRTLSESVAACLYALCTSAAALLLFIAHLPTFTSSNTGRCSWRILSPSSCLEQLASGRKFNSRRMSDSLSRQSPSLVAKQVIYSIANSRPPAFHMCTTPTFKAGDDIDYELDDGPELTIGMRDCTGSSCSVPASLSAARFPVSVVGKCEECRLCRSATDGSTDDRSLSRRNSTRLNDFDDLDWSSDEEEDHDGCVEGGWWNGEVVDVDSCSIHRAPCPSPASACSSRVITKTDQEDRRSESSLGQLRRLVFASPSTCRLSRMRTVPRVPA